MRRLTLPLMLGLAHGVADGAAGLLIGGLPHVMTAERVALLVLLYNLLAFGGQPLMGMLADHMRRPRVVALGGLLLLAAALVASGRPELGIVLAGLGSAAFHVGGGALALCATRGRAAGPGLFAAPGVVGLAAGGALAIAGYDARWAFIALLACLGVAILVLKLPPLPYRKAGPPRRLAEATVEFDRHDLVMLLLLAGIALRSVVWNVTELLVAGRVDMLLALALAAAAGKILGGSLADWVGWRRYTLAALALAAALLAFADRNLWLLLGGVALLQSTTPAALAASGRLLPRSPATAAGLALGLAIALGGLPIAVGLGPPLTALAPWLALAAALALGGGLVARSKRLTRAAPTTCFRASAGATSHIAEEPQ